MYKKVYVEFWNQAKYLDQVNFFSKLLLTKNQNIELKPICISKRNKFIYLARHIVGFMRLEAFKTYSEIEYINSSIFVIDHMADELITSISNEQDLLDLKIDGLEIGRDILEGYLIEAKLPKITFNPKFYSYMKNCIYIYEHFKSIFKNEGDDACLVLSHGLYKWGIIGKAAIASGVDVFCISEHSFYRLSHQHPYCTPDFENYKRIFDGLDKDLKSNGTDWARKRLDKRLQGIAGVDITHNKISAFGENHLDLNIDLLELNEDTRSIVICPSCFFDNPHAYSKFMFCNFWEWLEFIGEHSNTDHNWLVKAHPDVLKGNLPLLKLICKKYPHLRLIDHRIKFQELAKRGVTICLSIHGSVGHELPFLGIDVVNCAYNPHTAFDFNHQLRTKKQFQEFLNTPNLLTKKNNLEQIYEFYFIHFLYKKSISLRDYISSRSKAPDELKYNSSKNDNPHTLSACLFKRWLHKDEVYTTISREQVNDLISSEYL